MKLTSDAFAANSTIPVKYTCDGENVSSPLAWCNVPDGVKSFVLLVDDPDAPDPDAPLMTYVHWVLYNIPGSVRNLAEGISSNELPGGTLEGVNDWHRTGYGGPCPPIGRHRYFHKIYALNTVLPDLGKPDKKKVEAAMKGHVISSAELIGIYKRPGR